MEGDGCRACEAPVVSSVGRVSATPRRRLGGRVTSDQQEGEGEQGGVEAGPGCRGEPVEV